MKFLIRLILITLCCYFLPFYLPWWSIFIFTAVIGYLLPGNGFNAFNSGFLGGGLVWLAYSFKLDSQSNSILSEKIVQLFPVSDSTYLIIAAALIGAISAGLGTLTGNSFRQIFIKKKKSSLYS